jgi:cardiolipin synthase (CMP-forming)
VTTANKITVIRILLVPFFIVQLMYYAESGNELHRLLAIVAFAVAAISDGLDGYIARRYNQRSELGAVLDPLADKLLLVSGIVILSIDNGPVLPRIPLWLTVTILSRDMLLLIGLALLHYLNCKVTIRPVFVGKVATVLQMICVIWGLFKWPSNWLLYWSIGAAVCTGISGIIYVWLGLRQLSASPSSAASP